MPVTDHDLHIKGLSIDWDRIDRGSYLRGIAAISGMNSLRFRKPVTFFVGENGSGKSTMLEAIAQAGGINPGQVITIMRTTVFFSIL